MKRSLVITVLCGTVLFCACAAVGNAGENATIGALQSALQANGMADAKVKAFVAETLLPLCTNAVFVAEVKAQNGKNVSLADIQALDKKWSEAEDELPEHVEKTSNACAEEIKRLAAAHPAILEAFVMDNQGANVGQNALTSDYWQGDEPKWQNSFNGGQGGLDVGKVSFDKSTNAQLQQVSLPIIDGDGKVVGAITCGISLEELK